MLQFLRIPSLRPRRRDDAGELIGGIRAQAAALRPSPDERLLDAGRELRGTILAGASPDSAAVLQATGALVVEAIRRTFGFELFDVQLRAGIEMARGRIAEMATGEGKTLTAALPASVWGFAGRGVHLGTVNQYLADRDCQQLRPVYRLLGLSAELLPERASPALKRKAYAADITYGAGYEFGFDYLRDQAALWSQGEPRLGQQMLAALRGRETPGYAPIQPRRAMCIVDEIDGVLIDEARTPLVLSQGSQGDVSEYEAGLLAARHAALQLEQPADYVLETRTSQIRVTRQGEDAIARLQPAKVLLQRPWSVYVRNALHAEFILDRDVHYVVNEEGVQLVDEYTGRIFADRVLRNGLHQAVEAKEGLPVSAENPSMAKICRQRFYLLYDRLCGMTGTATGNEHEFKKVFNLQVVPIPLARPSRRQVLPTQFFATEAAKYAAIVADVAARHAAGQPVLVGTRTIQQSEVLAEQLRHVGISVNLLNGKQDLAEAEAVARAGELRAVTVATNMAGRGTDIRLAKGVEELGGLHVAGVECHESPRVDRQLAGRCARQGDPGSCQFYVSADDELLQVHAPKFAEKMKRLADDRGRIAQDLSQGIRRLQQSIEIAQYQQRLQMIREDERLSDLLAKAAGVIPA